jgi:hypothetical protein
MWRMASDCQTAIRVARALYGRWRTLEPHHRERLDPLAEGVKRRALDLRGKDDPQARSELAGASEELAVAMLISAESDPDLDEAEVRTLHDDLQRELDRLASADVRASRGQSA